MLKRLIGAAVVALSLLLPTLAPLAQAQSGEPFFQIPFVEVPGARDVKFPEVAGFANIVSIASNTNQSAANFWEKADTSTGIAGPRRLGDLSGQPDFSTASLEYGDDGSLYYVWSDLNAKRIYIRVRKPGQDFGPQVLITGASGWPGDPDVAVTDTPAGRFVFVFWREVNGELRYRFSQTDGASWSGTGTVNTGILPEFSVYGGPNGALAVGYTRSGGSKGAYQAYVDYWNGPANLSFRRERISVDNGTNYGEPTVAQRPDGSYIAVYRGIDENKNFGTYIASRNSDGTWNNTAPYGRIDTGDLQSQWVDVDPLGNWHLFYSGKPTRTGQPNVYYARFNGGQMTRTRAIASSGSAVGGVYNLDGALTVRDNAYAHTVYERFTGGLPRMGYSMVASPGNLPRAEAIVVEGGAEFTNKATVRVDFVNPANSPTQVRFRWGSAPTPDDQPIPFTNPLLVPLPPVANPEACTALTLYTQLVNGSGSQIGANFDAVGVDRAAQATASVAAAQPGLDPSFTRASGATVTVRNAGDCVGLQSATVTGGAAAVTIPINGAPEASGSVTLGGGDGTKTISVAIADKLGNTRTISGQLTLDTTAPDLNDPGDVDISAGADFSGIVDVDLSGVSLAEANLYGVQVTTRYTPAGGSAVTGAPQIIPATLSGGRLAFSYSVASGLPAGSADAGSYQLTIRFIDKAGNVSTGSTSSTITFSESPAFPRIYMPLVVK